MKSLSFVLLLIVFLFYKSTGQNSYEKKLLLDNWTVNVNNCPRNSKQSQKNYELPTSVPTTLHLDMLKHNKIGDPFFSNNWQQQKWVSECNAFYKRNISLSEDLLQYQIINLVFEGIDTYSTVKLNSKEILTTQNAFVQYKVNVNDLLKSGQNLLQVQIKSTKTYDNKGQIQNKMPFPYAQTRKACYQYSWDWAPFMNTLGIWKNVYIQVYDQIAIDYVWVQLQKLQQKQAILTFAVKTHLHQSLIQSKKYQVVVFNNDIQLNRSQIAETETYFTVRISDPHLWWPNGIGEPYMYNFEVKLIAGQKTIHSKKVPYGIRTVRLDQASNSFTLIVNGYRIYCKGANYVPPDMMYPRAVESKKIVTLLQDTVRSNFNMIRVWGGGQYESDEFYQLASKMGIMIFHDFMFSDSIYPSTKEFLDNVRVEIVQQVRRIRNYPALVLWAGNNQVLQGIQSWGWKAPRYKNDYKKLFQQLIPDIISHESPYIPYVPSSPVKGVGNGGFERGGDVHYWGVWAAKAPFQNYQNAIGPFNSEFGTQSLPVWETIKQFTTDNGRSYSSNQLLAHERHNSQFHTLIKYMEMYAKVSINFQMEAYQSGLVQAYGIEIAIKAERASKNRISMGTLYWQLNDAWPAISWSAIDYYGRWKPLQYKAKTLYQNTIAFYHHKSKQVIAINDNLYDVNCWVETRIVTFSGQVLKAYNQTVRLRQNQAKRVFALDQQHEMLQNKGSNVVVFTKLIMSDKKEVSVSTFIKPYKDLQLTRCELHVRFEFDSNSILLAAQCLIKSVHVYHAFKYLSLTDNYIDVVPGEVCKTTLLGEDLKALQKQLKFKSYIQVYDKEELQVVFD